MASINEIALATLQNDMEVLSGRYQALAQSLFVKMEENNDKVVQLCETTIAKISALEEVLDSFVRVTMPNTDTSELDINNALEHLNAFVNRDR